MVGERQKRLLLLELFVNWGALFQIKSEQSELLFCIVFKKVPGDNDVVFKKVPGDKTELEGDQATVRTSTPCHPSNVLSMPNTSDLRLSTDAVPVSAPSAALWRFWVRSTFWVDRHKPSLGFRQRVSGQRFFVQGEPWMAPQRRGNRFNLMGRWLLYSLFMYSSCILILVNTPYALSETLI